MADSSLSPAQANLKLALLQANADATSSIDIYTWCMNSGLPNEVATRLHDLLTITKKVGGKVLAIGKIVLIKIIEFVKAHPFLITGIGIGAAIGTAITSLVVSIPILGPILSPIATALGIGLTVTGAIIGHNLDKRFNNVGQDIVEIAKSFFQLLADVFNTVFRDVVLA